MVNNWIIRIQDGRHFFSNANNGIWAIRNLTKYSNLLKKMNKGDNLYFMQNKNSTKKNGLITAYGEFDSYYDRNIKIINQENIKREFNKNKSLFPGVWNLEIKFINFIDLRKKQIGKKASNNLVTGILSKNCDSIMPPIIFGKFIDDFTKILNTIRVI